MAKRKLPEPSSREGTGTGTGTGTPETGVVGVRRGRGNRGNGRGTRVVEVDKEVRPKRAKGLTARDKNPSAGRDSDAAAGRAAALLKAPPPEPKPLVILPFESTLAYVFKGAGGRETAVNAARMLQEENEPCRKIVYAWDTATQRDRDTIKLEDLCAAAGISPDEFLGLIIPALWRRNLDIGKLIAAMAHPQIVEASVQAAKTTWGTLDRQMLHTQSGFLPTKAGQQINIDNRKQTLVTGGNSVKDTSAPGLPSFEQDCITGAEALRGDAGANNAGQKRLPAPKPDQEVTALAIIDAEVIE